ncbi:unnamed protein product, partial [Urochloa humidicola]
IPRIQTSSTSPQACLSHSESKPSSSPPAIADLVAAIATIRSSFLQLAVPAASPPWSSGVESPWRVGAGAVGDLFPVLHHGHMLQKAG